MNLEELLTQLKALEAAAEKHSDDPEYPDYVRFELHANGSGGIEWADGVYPDNWKNRWHFNALAELESVLAQALAEVGQP